MFFKPPSSASIAKVITASGILTLAAALLVSPLTSSAQTAAPTATSTTPLYTSCTEMRGTTPTPAAPGSSQSLTQIAITTLSASMQLTRQAAPKPTAAATKVATLAATQAAIPSISTAAASPTTIATSAATLASGPNYTVFQIAGAQSQACYEVGEALIGRNLPFTLTIGVSNAVAGQIAIDKTNVANTKVGEIVVDISQLKSDSAGRDGRIRTTWLQSNTYPLATFNATQIAGLPTGPYIDGTPINFQMIGTMNIHATDHEETFNVTATLTGTTLVGTASADILMTDFGFSPPSIPGFTTANNQTHVILNFVAYPVTP